jgi:PHD/YefM family antitoxin component YafN of YafNO toxin-antitoxin module
MPIDEQEPPTETAEVLSNPAMVAALEEGLGEIERDETVTLEELREELAAARPTND